MKTFRKPLAESRFAAIVVMTIVAGSTFAGEIRIPLPDGFSLTSTEGVATADGRHALAISERGAKTVSRIMQVAASGTVFTDLEGVADWVEYSADQRHLLVRQATPEDHPRPGSHVYSVIDNAGEVVWSTESTAAYRFTAGGNELYVAQFPGDHPHIRVFDVRGNLLRATEPRPGYLDARVLDGGEEALVLSSAPRSRSTDTRGGREVTVARIRLDEHLSMVWSVALDSDTLKYPELIPMDRDWVLITAQRGFIAVSRDGETTRYGSEEAVTLGGETNLADMKPASGAYPGSVLLYDGDRTLVMGLKSGNLTEVSTDPVLRFENVGYRDRHAVLAGSGEVVLKPLDEHGDTAREVRKERAVGRQGRQRDAGPGKQR